MLRAFSGRRFRGTRTDSADGAESEHVPLRRSWCLGGHVFAVLRRQNFALAPNPRLFTAVVSPDGFRVSRPIRRDTTDAPPPLGGPCAHGPPDVSLSGLLRPAAHASGAAGEHGAGRSAIRRSREDITWSVLARPRPETVRSIERGGLLVRTTRHFFTTETRRHGERLNSGERHDETALLLKSEVGPCRGRNPRVCRPPCLRVSVVKSAVAATPAPSPPRRYGSPCR